MPVIQSKKIDKNFKIAMLYQIKIRCLRVFYFKNMNDTSTNILDPLFIMSVYRTEELFK